MERLEQLQEEVLSYSVAEGDGPLVEEEQLLSQMKTLFLIVGGSAVQKFGTRIEEKQEVLSHLLT
ncbi:hypothetical protein M3650_01755 [Paenibacillus sp. MER TA 81-3]|nr:hypothetical protein [Paenibacillus sp. MER TA 81-3]